MTLLQIVNIKHDFENWIHWLQNSQEDEGVI